MAATGRDPDDLRALKARVEFLEHELDQVARTSTTSALLAASAVLMIVSLALPWSVAADEPDFDETAVVGWSLFFVDVLGVALGLIFLVTLGLTIAASASQSMRVSAAAHIAATWVCGTPMVLVLCYGLAQAEVERLAVGYHTGLIAVAAVAITAAIRRKQLRT